MTEKKTCSNETLSKKEIALIAEKQLLPRLKFMGYTLLLFTILAFGYALFEDSFISEEIEEEIEEIEEIPPFNPYIMASSFFTISIACFLYFWKKNKNIEHQFSLEQDSENK